MTNEPNRQAPGVNVKALEWKPFCDLMATATADPVGIYAIDAERKEVRLNGVLVFSGIDEDLHDAAQADYERRVFSALEPVAVQPGELDRKALEAAQSAASRTRSGDMVDFYAAIENAIRAYLSALVPSAPAPVDEPSDAWEDAYVDTPSTLLIGDLHDVDGGPVDWRKVAELRRDAIKRLTVERDEARSEVVFGFYEEEHPLFVQGYDKGVHELASPVTSEECAGYINTIIASQADNARLTNLLTTATDEFAVLRDASTKEIERLTGLLTEADEVVKPFAIEASNRPWLTGVYPEMDTLPIHGSALTNGDLRAALRYQQKREAE